MPLSTTAPGDHDRVLDNTPGRGCLDLRSGVSLNTHERHLDEQSEEKSLWYTHVDESSSGSMKNRFLVITLSRNNTLSLPGPHKPECSTFEMESAPEKTAKNHKKPLTVNRSPLSPHCLTFTCCRSIPKLASSGSMARTSSVSSLTPESGMTSAAS